jgi:hypothetical protein
MAELVIPATFQAVVHQQLPGGEEALNVLHYSLPGGIGSFTTLATDISNAIIAGYTGIKAFMDTSWRLTEIVVEDISKAGGESMSFAPAALVGTGTGVPLPNQIAAVVTLDTGVAGRSGRGRIYVGGFAGSAALESGSLGVSVLSPTCITALLTMVDDMFVAKDPAGAVQAVLAVASRVDVVSRQILRARCGNIWDTQRRRRNALPETRTTRILTA